LTGLYFLCRGPDDLVLSDCPATFEESFFNVFLITLGEFGTYSNFSEGTRPNPRLTRGFVLAYSVLSNVLLMNILIAQMAETYSTVQKSATNEFLYHQCSLISEYEDDLSPAGERKVQQLRMFVLARNHWEDLTRNNRKTNWRDDFAQLVAEELQLEMNTPDDDNEDEVGNALARDVEHIKVRMSSIEGRFESIDTKLSRICKLVDLSRGD